MIEAFYAYVTNNPASFVDPLGLKGERRNMPVVTCASAPAPSDPSVKSKTWAWTCCQGGQPALCATATDWSRYTPHTRYCLQVHEGMHADDIDATYGCGGCNSAPCALAPGVADPKAKRHCQIYYVSYQCFRGQGEQGPDGESMEKEFDVDGCGSNPRRRR